MKQVTKETSDRLHCELQVLLEGHKCGTSVVEELFPVKHLRDGEWRTFELCEDCYDNLLDSKWAKQEYEKKRLTLVEEKPFVRLPHEKFCESGNYWKTKWQLES